MTKEEYWYVLCNVKGIYQNEIKSLINAFGAPEEIFKVGADKIAAALKRKDPAPEAAAEAAELAANLLKAIKDRSLPAGLEKLTRDGIQFIHYESEKYPLKLKMLKDPPYSLYVRGKLPDEGKPACGMVGARACSGYGREMALKFSRNLAANGVQIISGMAIGIDSYASMGALDVGGKTFVVLGSGLDEIYPRDNTELYYKIAMTGGVISEYPMGTKPLAWQFPHRNRLISAFSDCLLVMEARKHSGTLITAQCALEQGRDVYALPGRANDPLSEGCNRLIADGAGILINTEYLLETIEGSYVCDSNEQAADSGGILTPVLRKIYDLIRYEPVRLDELESSTDEPANALAAAVMELELLGLICEISKDCFVRVN